ncbi:hypothetical protein A4X13_0g1947 [Tilletia indica]|uniref:Uncharacterized protein n=1 Tax=Tilletia indica TaxID=43049 RepID=A0A177TTU7_9BASI|nr:hypothetical protein A4X13_0g1947 [Tilletia indica]
MAPSSTHSSSKEKNGTSMASNTFKWDNVTFTTKSRGKQVTLLNGISASIRGGQMLAVLGPSGSGKTTLLDCLAGRKSVTSGQLSFNGTSSFSMHAISSYVEQEDALLGVLTVEETLTFTTKLAFPTGVSAAEIQERVKDTMEGLGLSHVASNIIGTPIQRGISGGQKRRVTIGNALVTLPKILLLDEPTSGLDSNTAYEVLLKIRSLAQTHNIAVLCTIHSPNWETFSLFEKALLLARGRTMYLGPTQEVAPYFAALGHPCPTHTNPADHALRLISTDFQQDSTPDGTVNDDLRTAEAGEVAVQRSQLDDFAEAYTRHEEQQASQNSSDGILVNHAAKPKGKESSWMSALVNHTVILTHRNFVNYRRNLLAYGIRCGMYLGMGIMIAAVFQKLPSIDSRINDRLSAHFYGVAFLAFMSVAGIPSFLEERAVLMRERRNHLYTSAPYVLANSAATVPFLFICSVLFSAVAYWAVGLRPDAQAFFRFVAFLFLSVYAAECQALLIAALVPLFVAALAICAFANGFFMSVQGYFLRTIPTFWRVWAHQIDYETWAFQLLVRNDLTGLVFPCVGDIAARTCQCSFPSSLIAQGQCAVSGEDVIRSLNFSNISTVQASFVLVAIIVVYRLAFWAVLARNK